MITGQAISPNLCTVTFGTPCILRLSNLSSLLQITVTYTSISISEAMSDIDETQIEEGEEEEQVIVCSNFIDFEGFP